MRTKSVLMLVMVLWVSAIGTARCRAAADLSQEMQTLGLDNKAPAGVSAERLYAVQSRYNRLSQNLELDLGGANNFNPGSYLSSQEISADLKFYLSDRFFVNLNGSYVFNSLSTDGNRLWQEQGIFPDVSCVKYRADTTVGYNLFYGKFRLSMDTVFYFDQYWALGGGWLDLTNGLQETSAFAPVAQAGFVFWFGRHWNVNIGIKDYYFQDQTRERRTFVHHVLGTFSIGFLFGGGDDV